MAAQLAVVVLGSDVLQLLVVEDNRQVTRPLCLQFPHLFSGDDKRPYLTEWL